jgi:hypothetical protein
MGRETRQARRARERREQELRRSHTAKNSRTWAIAGGIGVIVVALLLFAGHTLASGVGKSTAASGLVPTPKEAPGKVIDGVVGCGSTGMAPGYHVHMHLAMYDAGKPVTLPALVGFNYNHDCLYWLHTHDTTGIIHLESPNHLVPTLGNFFDVWGQPLSATQMATESVKSGQRMETFVNMKPYNGNPRDIKLTPHATITIEIGPPFVKPQPFNFGTL